MRRIGIAVLGLCVTLTTCGAAFGCTGDCNGDGSVRVNELVTGVGIALGHVPPGACEALACPQVGGISISCTVAAVNNALVGCPTSPPSPTPTACPGPEGGPCSVTFEGVTYPGVYGEGAIFEGRCLRVCIPRFPDVCRETCSTGNDCLTIWSGSIVHGRCQRGSCEFPGGTPTRAGVATATPTRTFPLLPTATPPTQAEPTPASPVLSLALHVIPFPLEHRFDIDARIAHLGGPPVSYREGCSALCRPPFYDAIYFDVIGPNGEAVFIDDPCGGPFYCPEYLEPLSAGGSRTQTLAVSGTSWKWDRPPSNQCGLCTESPLADGRYIVTARFEYRIGCDWTHPPEPALTATAELDWPPPTTD